MRSTRLLKVLIFSAISLVVAQLFRIQVVEHQQWAEAALAQHLLEYKIPAKRGQIYVLDEGEPVLMVMNRTVWKVIVDPAVVEEETRGVILKELKDFIVKGWEKGFSNKKLRYLVVARDVPSKTAEELRGRKLKGVWFQREVKRAYPEGEMGSRWLGFVNLDGVGQYGVEGALNKELKGEDGLLKTIKDVNNVPLTIGNENVRVPAKDGKNVVLSIDRNIQRKLETVVAEQMKKSGVGRGSAVVMDPRNGKIRAMVDLPNYDPANYGMVKDGKSYLNEVTEVLYEPASVCKTFTFAAGVEKGKISREKIYHNKGVVMVDGKPVYNAYKGLIGEVTLEKALAFSLNTGSVQVLKWLGGSNEEITKEGREELYDFYYKRFGLGQKTGVELNEVEGLVVGPNQGYGRNIRYANMTFGQGMNVTMLQVAAGFAAVVNGGKYYQPTIIEGEMKEGKLVREAPKAEKRRVVSESTSEQMRQFLRGTRGWSRTSGVDKKGYLVGGKTGTAQVYRNGYRFDETVGSYVGFGGAELPEYVIMVKIWEEGKRTEGERDATPVFDQMSNYLQEYLRIKPKE